MGRLTNALQGNLNSGKGAGKVRSERQLDLFMSLSDRSTSESKPPPLFKKPEPKAEPTHRIEPTMVLPASQAASDVSAEVRAVLSDSGVAYSAGGAGETEGEAHAPLRTGIYQRPKRMAAPPPATVPPPPAKSRPRIPKLRFSPVKWAKEWFAGLELDRRVVALALVLVLLVAMVAFWSARRSRPELGTEVDLGALESETQIEPEPMEPEAAISEAAVPVAPEPEPVPAPVPVPTVKPMSAGDWKVAGTVAEPSGSGLLIRFSDSVFVSANNISIEGMRALKASGAKLAAMKTGAKVVVTGYTDDVPLSKPTPQFKSNADIAAARAKTATEHLAQFARSNKALVFEAVAGAAAQAPYPNDSAQNRRLNRTVTLHIVPAP